MLTALKAFAVLGVLGAWDTLYYHEWLLRLPSRPTARRELLLHALRDFVYGVLFSTLGWLAWNGAWACALAALLISEIYLTLWDFVEEDRTRKLPAGERIGHAIMGIVYGTFLALSTPQILEWARRPTGFTRVSYGLLSIFLTVMGSGVVLSGLRDLISSRRPV